MIYDYFVLFVGEDGYKIQSCIINSNKELSELNQKDYNYVENQIKIKKPEIERLVIINWKILRKVKNGSS